MHHAVLRHGARSFFMACGMACGENGVEVLDKVMGTKCERRTILYKPCVVTLGCLLVPVFGVMN